MEGRKITIMDHIDDVNVWEHMAFLIVPSGLRAVCGHISHANHAHIHKHAFGSKRRKKLLEMAIDPYSEKVLLALVSKVMILTEAAIDQCLKLGKWPSNSFEMKYEYKHLPSIELRLLVPEGLFAEQSFCFLTEKSGKHTKLCSQLVYLGQGKIVETTETADYIVGDTHLQKLDIKHCTSGTIVTPQYIYDAVLNYKLLRPSIQNGHIPQNLITRRSV